MPTRFESAVITCAASVSPSAPTEVPLGFAGGILRHWEIIITPGHAGLTGISLGYGHRGVIPYGVLAYYSGDDDRIERDHHDTVPGAPWSAFVCNNDLQSHVWEVRFDYDELNTGPQSSLVVTPTAEQILAAGASAMSGA